MLRRVLLSFTLACATAGAQSATVSISRDTVVDGVTCGSTGRARAELHPGGQIKSCPVAHDTSIAGNAFARGSWIFLDEARVLTRAWLVSDTRLSGRLCKGTGYKGWSVEFHASGSLRLCFLARVEEIDGVPCEKGSFMNELRGSTAVTLAESGTLTRCRAARDFRRNGVLVRKGTVVEG